MSRKVKDAKDITTGELVYLRGHAKATYMSDGASVEDAISEVRGSIPDTSEFYTKAQIDAKGYLTAHQDISGKQDKLVSGTNIKTIDGVSILGSGNIAANKVLNTGTTSTVTVQPNTYYRNTSTSLSSLTILLAEPSYAVGATRYIDEYLIEFTTRSAGTTVSLPSGIKWANGETPTFEAGTTYQISIVNGLGIVTKFK